MVRVGWGSRGAAQRRLLSGQSCWPITGRSCFGGLSGRRPTSTSGGVHWQEGALLPRGPDLHDLPLFSFLRDLHCFTESLLPFPSDFPGESLAVANPRLLIDPIVLVPIVVVPTSANSRDGDQNMTSFVPPGSAFVTTRAVLSNLGKRDNLI